MRARMPSGPNMGSGAEPVMIMRTSPHFGHASRGCPAVLSPRSSLICRSSSSTLSAALSSRCQVDQPSSALWISAIMPMDGSGDGVGASHRQLITRACPPFNAAAGAHRLRVTLPARGLPALAAAPFLRQGAACPGTREHRVPGRFSVLSVHGCFCTPVGTVK